MVFDAQKPIHPTIRKCLQHLDIIKADDKTKQIVYMYMETLLREKDLTFAMGHQLQENLNPGIHSETNRGIESVGFLFCIRKDYEF